MTSALAVPAAPALMAQQPTKPPSAVPATQARPVEPGPSMEIQKLDMSVAEEAGEAVAPKFFTAAQFATLQKLSGILTPARKGMPGALETQTPAFLDFLIGQSPAERKQVYTKGLDALQAASQKKFGKPFAQLEQAQAETLLGALRQPWTYDPPADPLARFLQAAKLDVRNATMLSKPYITAGGGGARRPGATGLYWHELD